MPTKRRPVPPMGLTLLDGCRMLAHACLGRIERYIAGDGMDHARQASDLRDLLGLLDRIERK